jgi:uncharacterized phiE125 gp8 family phage protein
MQGYFQLSNTKIISQANAAGVTLAEAKAHLRVSFPDDDDLITALIEAATGHIQNVIEQPIREASMSLNFDVEGHGYLDRIYIPVRNATGVDSVALDGVTLDSDAYSFNGAQDLPYIALNAPFMAGQVMVMFKAGFPIVPPTIRQAALLLIGHWYKNTDAVANGTSQQPYVLPLAVDSLLSAYKQVGIA